MPQTLQDVRVKHDELRGDEKPERFSKKRAPNGQHEKKTKQERNLRAHVKEERAYPKLVEQNGDMRRYGDLKIKIFKRNKEKLPAW